MICMAVYGAMIATTSGGGVVAIERALGWSRQLRLTPLTRRAYVADQDAHRDGPRRCSRWPSSFVVGARQRAPQMPGWTSGSLSALVAWLGSLVFAAFGLFIGYLLPSENVMQFIGPVLALLAFFGGLFVPLEVLRRDAPATSRSSPRCTAWACSPARR